jgi:acyl carrier protein
MTNQEIFEKLNEIFSDVFDEEITVTAETTSADVEEWDSLTHITLISEVEEAFGFKFAMKDVLGMKNVGEMAQIIAKNI